jgi:hypothetical protein
VRAPRRQMSPSPAHIGPMLGHVLRMRRGKGAASRPSSRAPPVERAREGPLPCSRYARGDFKIETLRGLHSGEIPRNAAGIPLARVLLEVQGRAPVTVLPPHRRMGALFFVLLQKERVDAPSATSAAEHEEPRSGRAAARTGLAP